MNTTKQILTRLSVPAWNIEEARAMTLAEIHNFCMLNEAWFNVEDQEIVFMEVWKC